VHRKAQSRVLSQSITAGVLVGLLSFGFISETSEPAKATITHIIALECFDPTPNDGNNNTDAYVTASPASLTVAVGDVIRVSLTNIRSTTNLASSTGVTVVPLFDANNNINPNYTNIIDMDPWFADYPVTGTGEMSFTSDGNCQFDLNGVTITFSTNSGGGGVQTPQSSPAPQKQHVSTLNQNPAPGETVAMFGSYFGGVTEVFVGGIKAEIISKTDNRVNIRMPQGLTGALDVELKSPLGSLLLPKHFTIGKLPAAATSKKTLVVGGFAPNSRKLTARMQARIDRWLERNSEMTTLTCTGFTSLPRRTTDVELSTNRGKTACNFSKRQRAELETSVSQGIEDPRPGSNVRRVRLVLTP
jgi:hypothetical protein